MLKKLVCCHIQVPNDAVSKGADVTVLYGMDQLLFECVLYRHEEVEDTEIFFVLSLDCTDLNLICCCWDEGHWAWIGRWSERVACCCEVSNVGQC